MSLEGHGEDVGPQVLPDRAHFYEHRAHCL
jgi:hypothetical protein